MYHSGQRSKTMKIDRDFVGSKTLVLIRIEEKEDRHVERYFIEVLTRKRRGQSGYLLETTGIYEGAYPEQDSSFTLLFDGSYFRWASDFWFFARIKHWLVVKWVLTGKLVPDGWEHDVDHDCLVRSSDSV